jgi:hypothetical protein
MLTARPISKYDIITHTLSYEISMITNYIDYIDKSIEKKQNEFDKYYRENILNTCETSSYIDELMFQFEVLSPNLFYSSTLIAIHSLFETILKSLSFLLKEIKTLEQNPNEMNGMGIKKYHSYLTKVAKIDLSTFNEDWQKIQNYNHIRNIIVHCDGNPSEYNKFHKVKNFIDENSYIEIFEGENQIIIKNKQLLYDYCNLINSYINNALEKCPTA